MFFRLLPPALILALLLASPAGAVEIRQGPKAVVELFTSQGCPSSPVADAALAELAKQPEIIALAYHVDYWDYAGWPDTFGNAANSDRQRAYADSWGSTRIFTPQMVVNGSEGVVASRQQEVGIAIQNAALQVPVELETDSDMLKISIGPKAGLGEAVVWLVTFIDRADVAIERGENAGKTIAYTQIVTGRQVLGMWDPAAGAKLKLPLAEVLSEPANGAAILIQEDRDGLPGRILGAASFLR